MGKQMKLAWWEIGRGKMDQHVQEKFEEAQRIAAVRGLPVKIKLEMVIQPPRVNEPEYMPFAYKLNMQEPGFTSKEFDLVLRNGIAIKDAEAAPEQTHLELSSGDGQAETQRSSKKQLNAQNA